MTSSSLVKTIRSPLPSDAEVWVKTRPCCPTVTVEAACTATMMPIRKATAAARRMFMTASCFGKAATARLELRGGAQTIVEVVVAGGVRAAAVEAEIAHILHGQLQVQVPKRRIRLAPGHVADLENHAVRVGATVRGAPIVDVGRAGGAKVLDRRRDSGGEAVG